MFNYSDTTNNERRYFEILPRKNIVYTLFKIYWGKKKFNFLPSTARVHNKYHIMTKVFVYLLQSFTSYRKPFLNNRTNAGGVYRNHFHYGPISPKPLTQNHDVWKGETWGGFLKELFTCLLISSNQNNCAKKVFK